MCFDELSRDPQTEAKATEIPDGDRAFEPPEEPRLVRSRDADASILHHESRVALMGVDADIDRLSRTVLDRVGEQVGDDVFDPEDVPGPVHGAKRGDAKFRP